MTTLEAQLEARARWDDTAAAMMTYTRSCRNREKRSYAVSYAAHLLTGAREPDTSCYALGYMGAQAVRLALAAIRDERA